MIDIIFMFESLTSVLSFFRRKNKQEKKMSMTSTGKKCLQQTVCYYRQCYGEII